MTLVVASRAYTQKLTESNVLLIKDWTMSSDDWFILLATSLCYGVSSGFNA